MNRNDIVEKRLKKIEKSEDKAVKLLNKRKKELTKAIEENEQLIEQKLNRGSSAEQKLEAEIEKLTKRLETLNEDMRRVRAKREDQILPLRERSIELKEKLKLVESQLETTISCRDRSFSRMDLNSAQQRPFDENEDDRLSSSLDLSPSSPPPYFEISNN